MCTHVYATVMGDGAASREHRRPSPGPSPDPAIAPASGWRRTPGWPEADRAGAPAVPPVDDGRGDDDGRHGVRLGGPTVASTVVGSAAPGVGRPVRERLGIRELRGRLTSLVRRAGSGERIVITIAGRPVAQLGPVEPAAAVVTIDDLVARGLLEPARRRDRPPPDVLVDSWTGRRLDRALREVRGA